MDVGGFEYFSESILSVSEINGYVKELLDGIPIFSSLRISGEISNFKKHTASGHLYFSLKDDASAIKAVMFRANAQSLKFVPENGMKVVVTGRLSAYTRDGIYQLYVNSIEPDGLGALHIAFERLKKRLEAEGLFDSGRKKPIPRYPKTVGVITSPTGAAVRDIINVLSRRYPLAEILVFPALVQGDGAEGSLIAGIKYFNSRNNADVLIIGRGGGSIEDLWAFNSEALAYAIADSGIPVISAVGHETDFTICDLVSDLRAPTPSAAAELAVPDSSELYRLLGSLENDLKTDMAAIISAMRKRLLAQSERRVLRSPESFIDYKRERLDYASERLIAKARTILERDRSTLSALASKLNALSPLAVLGRGFSAAFGDSGKIIRSTSELPNGSSFVLRMSDGCIKAISCGASEAPEAVIQTVNNTGAPSENSRKAQK